MVRFTGSGCGRLNVVAGFVPIQVAQCIQLKMEVLMPTSSGCFDDISKAFAQYSVHSKHPKSGICQYHLQLIRAGLC